jgi:hypothetical protein
MSKIKRRPKKDPSPDQATPPPARTARVTLAKDVSSRYRKLVPRAQAGGSAPGRPWSPKGAPHRPERDDGQTKPPSRDRRGPHSGSAPARPWSPKGAPHRPERDGGQAQPPRPDRRGPHSGSSEALKTLVRRDLPEVAKQLRETQNLLRGAAEAILTLLEDWERLAPEKDQAARNLVTALLEKMSFQDLAGQRLAKVEKFFKALDEIGRPAAGAGNFRPHRTKPFSPASQAMGPETRPGRPHRAKPFSPASQATGSKAKPPISSDKNLKGPQAPGEGLEQREVEALLADLFHK